MNTAHAESPPMDQSQLILGPWQEAFMDIALLRYMMLYIP
jgi:hypothetical protein